MIARNFPCATWRQLTVLGIPSRTRFHHPLRAAIARRTNNGLFIKTYSTTISSSAEQPAKETDKSTGLIDKSIGLTGLNSTIRLDSESSAQPAGPVVNLPQAAAGERKVSIGWTNGVWSRFHNIWLRDHCRCPECFHPITKQRLVDTFTISPNIQPTKVVSKIDGLEVTWPASPLHVSFYPWNWLMHNSYDPLITPHTLPDGKTGLEHAPPSKILWGSRIQKDPPTVSYEEVIKDDDIGLLKWLEKIDQFGFCFVSGVPPTPEDTEKLISRISHIRITQYGGFWDFTSDLSHGDTAYTDIALKAHTDTTYYTDPCGLQIFHLLSHTAGGPVSSPTSTTASTTTTSSSSSPSSSSPPPSSSSLGGQTLLVDGFYAASILKDLHANYYDLLSRVDVPTHSAGSKGSFYSAHGPILIHSPPLSPSKDGGGVNQTHGHLVQVRYNNDDRSVMKSLQGHEVEAWYDALRAWNQCLTSPDSEYWVQLSPGTMVAIDNHRVLHGRSAFSGKRRMCGAYIGMDDFRSKLNVLRSALGGQAAAAATGGGGRSVWEVNL